MPNLLREVRKRKGDQFIENEFAFLLQLRLLVEPVTLIKAEFTRKHSSRISARDLHGKHFFCLGVEAEDEEGAMFLA